MRSSIFERQFFGQTLRTSSNLGGLNSTSYLDSRYSLGQQPYTSDEELAKAEKAYSDISKTGSKSEVEKAYAKYKDAYEKVLEELADRAKLEKLAEEQSSDIMGDDPKGFNKRLKDRAGQMEKIWPGWYDSHLAWKIYESTGGQPKWYRDMLDAGATAANIALQLFLLKQQAGVSFKRPSIPTWGRPATPSIPKPVVPSMPKPAVPSMPTSPVRPTVPSVEPGPRWVKTPPTWPMDRRQHGEWIHPETGERYMLKSDVDAWRMQQQQPPPVLTPGGQFVPKSSYPPGYGPYEPKPQSKVQTPDRPAVATCDTSKGQFYDPQTGQCRGSISTFPGGMPGDFGGAASMPTSSYASQVSSMTSMGRAGFLHQVSIAPGRRGF
jgi:hypothetical protein